MKLYESLDMEQMRETWAVKDNAELSYYGGKMPAFTPAVQGQESGMNPNSGIQHYSALHNVLSHMNTQAGWMSVMQYPRQDILGTGPGYVRYVSQERM